MVSVPVTNNRSIRNVDPVSRERLRGSTPRDFVGGAVQEFGGALGQAASDFDAIEATYDEADATRIANEYREFERERLRTGENAYLSTQGFNAGNGREGTVADLQGHTEDLLGGARSERARAMAKRALDDRLNTSQETIARHATAQMVAAREEQSQARVDGAITDAIDARGTDQFAVQLGVAQQELGDQALRQGWSAEQLEQQNETLVSNVYARTALAIDAEDGEPSRALQFVEDNADLIGPDEQARLTAQLAPRVDSAWARDTFSSEIVTNYAPKAPEVPVASGEAGEPVADGAAVISELFPNVTITSHYRGPNHPLSRANPSSYHTQTRAAVDTARIPGMTFDQYVQQIEDAGYTVIEAIDEYSNPSPHATGGHWHVVVGGAGDPAAAGSSADPRLNSRQMRQAVDAYVADNPNISERRRNALYAEADRAVNVARADRAQLEQAADRRVQDWLTENAPGADDLTSMAQIPSALLNDLSPSTRSAINARIQSTSSRIQAANDAAAAREATRLEQEAVFELYTLSDEELAQVDMSRYAGRIPLDKLGPWIDRQQSAANGGGTSSVSGDRIASRIDTLGKDFGASRDADASDDERQAWIELRGYVERRVGGRSNDDVSNEELRSVIIAGMQEVQIEGTGWFGSNLGNETVPRSQLPDGSAVDLDDLPDEMIADIRHNLQSRGVPNPSDTLVWTTYQEGRAQGIF